MSIRFGRSGAGYDSSQVMETADDDWRQVTDLSERRKIQNRLAQRNYRRKLRQRLEELERKAGVQPPSSPPTLQVPKARSGRVSKPRARTNSRASITCTTSFEPEPLSAATSSASDVSPVTPYEGYPGPSDYPLMPLGGYQQPQVKLEFERQEPRYQPTTTQSPQVYAQDWNQQTKPEYPPVCLPAVTESYLAAQQSWAQEVPQFNYWTAPQWDVPTTMPQTTMPGTTMAEYGN